ncbi:hypothetical protein [Paenibacillus dendritiformis]|uniref:hypothetical protein n=1 Tax=Paenibacillus dendritiformis TaxID=130049 RepID=UPI001BD11D78|nr:hypothetical protein [Paenibacillus dendritiformis]
MKLENGAAAGPAKARPLPAGGTVTGTAVIIHCHVGRKPYTASPSVSAVKARPGRPGARCGWFEGKYVSSFVVVQSSCCIKKK